MTDRKPDAMTNSVLVNATLMKREDHIVIPSKSLADFDGEYLLVMYIKSKRLLQISALKNMDGFDIVNLTMFSTTGDLLKFSVVMSQSIFKNEGFELIWTSGVCTPDEESRKRLGIPEKMKDGCVWEGVIKVPSAMTADKIKTEIKQIDKASVLSRIDVKTIERV